MKALNNGNGSILESEVNYIFQRPTCGDNSEVQTVREWLSEFGLVENEEFFKIWMQLVVDYGKAFRSVEAKRPDDGTVDILASFVFRAIYLDYNIKKPFMSQFLRNIKRNRKDVTKLLPVCGVIDDLSLI